MYNRIVNAPGNNIALGNGGGVLILQRPGLAPGSMTFSDMQNRVWSLLREKGPDTGYPIPLTGDFPQGMVQRDLNLAFAEFFSQTGIAPGLIERQDVLPVFPVLDYPVPPGLQSLRSIEYTPYGMPSYVLDGYSFDEFNIRTGGWISATTGGNPAIYREPYAGYVRLQPQPGPGNAVGPGVGYITFTGVPAAGQQVTVTMSDPGVANVTTPAYTVLSTDTLASIAFKVSSLINNSNAVLGLLPFMAPSSVSGNQIQINALTPPGTQITYFATVTGTLVVSPNAATNLSPTGDTMTWYYSAAGNLLVYPGDSPMLPPQFHMAPVYRVLADYWQVKEGFANADRYLKKFNDMVARGKALQYDTNQSTERTMAGEDMNDWYWQPGISY